MNDKLVEKFTKWCEENNVHKGYNDGKYPTYYMLTDSLCLLGENKEYKYILDIKDSGLIILSKVIILDYDNYNRDIIMKLNIVENGIEPIQNWLTQNTDYTRFPTLTPYDFY